MRPSCAPGWWQILGLAQGEVFGTHWMLLPCSHSSSTVRIWVPLCANLGQEDVDVSRLIPLGLLTLSWRSQGISERCPTQRQWGDPGLEGGCRKTPFLHRHLGDCRSSCSRHRAGTRAPQECGCTAIPARPAARHRLTSCIPASCTG